MIETIVERQDEVKEDEYPKLMVSDIGRIVYFVSYREGFLIEDKEERLKPHFSTDWAMGCFKDFHGKVTLISK